MTANSGQQTVTNRWYSRPVLFVADINRAADFYINSLGFEKAWHEAEGKGTVCQVNRSDCEIILSQDPSRRDQSRIFVELTREGIAELQREIEERDVPHRRMQWGYEVILVEDLDGNELLFPLEV